MKNVTCSDWSSEGSYQWQIFFGFGGVNTWTQSSVMYWLGVSMNCNSTKQLGYMKWKNYLGTLVLCLRGRCGYATMQIDWHTLPGCGYISVVIYYRKSGNCPLAAHTVLWVPSIGGSHCTLSEAEVLPPTAVVKVPLQYVTICWTISAKFNFLTEEVLQDQGPQELCGTS